MPSSKRDKPVILQVLHVMSIGGAEVLVDRMVRALADEFDFAIACLDESGSLGETLVEDGFRVCNLNRAKGIDRHCYRRLREFSNEVGAQVLHAHQYTPFFYSLAARGLRRNLPIVLTEHGRHHPDYRKWKRVVFNRILSRRCDRIVGVGEAVRHALIKNEGFPKSQVEVIYNGVCTKRFQQLLSARCEMPTEFNLPRNARVVIQVARLDYLKDHLTAARAFNILAEQDPLAHWLIVGDGPEKSAIVESVNATAHANRVRFVGERSDVPKILAGCDVMLLSSISEGIPLVLIEGMLTKLPVVSTNVGGVPEVIRDGVDGILVPPKTPDALARALQTVLGDLTLATQYGENGCKRAKQLFSETRMHNDYAAVYRTCLSPNSNAAST